MSKYLLFLLAWHNMAALHKKDVSYTVNVSLYFVYDASLCHVRTKYYKVRLRKTLRQKQTQALVNKLYCMLLPLIYIHCVCVCQIKTRTYVQERIDIRRTHTCECRKWFFGSHEHGLKIFLYAWLDFLFIDTYSDTNRNALYSYVGLIQKHVCNIRMQDE